MMKPIMNFIATGSLPFQEKTKEFLSTSKTVYSSTKSLTLSNLVYLCTPDTCFIHTFILPIKLPTPFTTELIQGDSIFSTCREQG